MKKELWVGMLFSALPVWAGAAGSGDMDPGFNNGLGSVATLPQKAGTGFNGSDIIQQADGKLVAVGNTYNKKNIKQFAVLRYNTDGSLDTTFNGTGIVTSKVSDLVLPVDDAKAVIQQRNGRLVVVGITANGANDDCAVVRYNKDGSLDETFGDGGIVRMAFGTGNDRCYSVIQQSGDDKLVIAGQTTLPGTGVDFALARFNADGSLDGSFGSGGKVTTDFGGSANNPNYGIKVLQQSGDGKLVVTGYSDHDFAVARYNANGTPDTTLNGTGRLFVDASGKPDYLSTALQQADGKLVLAGRSATTASNDDFAVVRLNLDGSFDTSFNGTGKLILPVGLSTDAASSVMQQADGKLVLAGYGIFNGGKHTAVVRLNTDGSLDTSFSNEGKMIASIGTVMDETLSVAGQADGKLVVAGTGNNGKFNYMMLARFHTAADTDDDGVPDSLDAFPDNAAATIDTDSDGKPDAWLQPNPYACAPTAPTCNGLTLDEDSDNDGVLNTVDNCPLVSNPGQEDANHDGYGDACAGDAPALNITRGIKAKDGAGTAVAFAGDVDQDGFGDYVVGYPGYDLPGKADAGRAEVISGRTGEALMSVNGNAAKDNMGFSVAGNADIDGDGFLDVAIGAPKADPNGLKDAGTVTILYGPDGSKPRTVLSGTRVKALFGSAVALGDTNDDGYADVVVGAPKDNDLESDPSVPVMGAGSVTVFSGASDHARLNIFYGILPKSYAGTSVAAADFDGDGSADIAIGAPNDDNDTDPDFIIRDTGSVAVYSIDGSNLMYEYGMVAKAYLGKSVAAGDIDGDGNAEVLAGAPGDTPLNDDDLPIKTRKGAGSVTVYGDWSWGSYGRTAKAGLGTSVALGDVDGDGLKDIIAGASRDSKPARKPVKNAGSVSVWSGDDLGLISRLYGSASKDMLGAAVAAGDVNSDGYDDVMLGAPGADTPASPPEKPKPVKDTGAVQVLSGAGL